MSPSHPSNDYDCLLAIWDGQKQPKVESSECICIATVTSPLQKEYRRNIGSIIIPTKRGQTICFFTKLNIFFKLSARLGPIGPAIARPTGPFATALSLKKKRVVEFGPNTPSALDR